jgi:hypothetical protein
MDFINSLLPFYPPVSESLSLDLLQINEFKELIGRTDDTIQGFHGYQIFVERFMSPFTPYKEILVKHSMGSGKTCTAFLILYIHLKGFGFSSAKQLNHCLLLAHNSSQLKNFKEGLRNCIKLLPEQDIYIESYIDKYLKEKTFGGIHRDNFQHLIKNVSIIIVDEAHAIHLKKEENGSNDAKHLGKESLYTLMKDFLIECKKQGKRIVLMTGTPISNHFSKLFQLMDLILPEDLSFHELEKPININSTEPNQKTIDNFYFLANGNLRPEMIPAITKRFAGRVSSLQKIKTKILQIEMGGFYNLDHEIRSYTETGSIKNVFFDNMVGYQREEYIKLLGKSSTIVTIPEEVEKGFKREETMVFFTFPKLDGVELKFSDLVNTTDQNRVEFIRNKFVDWRGRRVLFSSILSNPAFLKEHSILYYNVLVEMGVINASELTENTIGWNARTLSDKEREKRKEEAIFYYNDVVTGTANKLFSLVMKAYGFEQLIKRIDIEDLYNNMLKNIEETKIKGGTTKSLKKPRFVVISSNFGTVLDVDIEHIMNIFTHPSNRKGEYLRMIIGSKKLAFGYNLINGRQAHVVLQWNAPLMNQAIARLLRETSNFTDESERDERYVRVYKHFIGIDNAKVYSPNSYILFERRLDSMNKKEIKNAKILHLLDSTAVDCYINQQFHTSAPEFNNTRECNFMPCSENYNCSKFTTTEESLGKKFPNFKFTETDNSFIFHSSNEKSNSIELILSYLWLSGICSISISDLRKLINEKFPYITKNEIYFYLMKHITEQTIFKNKYGWESVIGSLNDVIFFKKSSIWIDSPVDIVCDIIKPILIEPSQIDYRIEEAFILQQHKDVIIEWLRNPTKEKYVQLNVLVKTYIFENMLPINEFKAPTKLVEFVMNEEYNNFINIDELKAITNVQPIESDKPSTSTNTELLIESEPKPYTHIEWNSSRFENVAMFHSIIARYHIKSHTVKKNIIFSEGMKVYTIKDGWKYLKIEDDIAGLIGEAMMNKVTNSTVTYLTREPTVQWFSEKIPSNIFDSELKFKLIIEDNIIKRKDVIEAKKERKGQTCFTITKKKLLSYLELYLNEFERISNIIKTLSTTDFTKYLIKLLKKFNLLPKKDLSIILPSSLVETSETINSIPLNLLVPIYSDLTNIPIEEYKKILRDSIINESSTNITKCEFLYKLQQVIYEKDETYTN